jgi:hypothetical protein
MTFTDKEIRTWRDEEFYPSLENTAEVLITWQPQRVHMQRERGSRKLALEDALTF